MGDRNEEGSHFKGVMGWTGIEVRISHLASERRGPSQPIHTQQHDGHHFARILFAAAGLIWMQLRIQRLTSALTTDRGLFFLCQTAHIESMSHLGRRLAKHYCTATTH
jgi:hypothetical protein